jgi:hypothetical protein
MIFPFKHRSDVCPVLPVLSGDTIEISRAVTGLVSYKMTLFYIMIMDFIYTYKI